MSERIRSFPPIARGDARVLILGTMPGVASLTAGQYYAHPRNAFWTIMSALLGTELPMAYGERVRLLERGGVALWDVLGTCHRAGSLDSAIEEGSIRINGFKSFFAAHSRIEAIAFNGAKAEAIYCRLVLPGLKAAHRAIPRVLLPSTSPAHAGRSMDDKLASWRALLHLTQTPVMK